MNINSKYTEMEFLKKERKVLKSKNMSYSSF